MADFIGEALGAKPETSRNCFAGMSACAALYRASLFREEEVFFRKEEKVLCEDLFLTLQYAGMQGKSFCCLNAFIITVPMKAL